MTSLEALLGLGVIVALLFSAFAVGGCVYLLVRPRLDHTRLEARVRDLAGLRQEWDNVLYQLDRADKRAARAARREDPPPASAPTVAARRTLSLAELQASRKEA